MAKVDFAELEKMDGETGSKFLCNNGYDPLALRRNPATEEYVEPYILYDDSDPENDDPDIIHSVSFVFFRKPNSNEPDKEELWHWWEDPQYKK